MEPLYQGKIDVFCAAYAVANAMRHLHALRLLACRELFHEALIELSRDETAFRDALNQHTDYTCWVDTMLENQKQLLGLRVEQPFQRGDVPLETVWATLADWFSGGTRRAVLFQFVRFLLPDGLQIRHWTCCSSVEDETIRLFDSSLDLGSLHWLERDWLAEDEQQAAGGQVFIVPYTIRLLRPHLEIPA